LGGKLSLIVSSEENPAQVNSNVKQFSYKSSLFFFYQFCGIVGGIDNFALFGFNREASIVQFETNSIHQFVPSSIYSRKKQIPVCKGQLFISI
jgi:hypothetical protein